MQLHGIPDWKHGEKRRNPVTALYFKNGVLGYSYRNSQETVTPGTKGKWIFTSQGEINLGKPILNKWNSFEIKHVFSIKENSGSIKIKFNGKEHSVNDINLGYNDKSGPYLKLGLYCPRSSPHEKLIVFFDDFEAIIGEPK